MTGGEGREGGGEGNEKRKKENGIRTESRMEYFISVDKKTVFK